MNPTVGDYASNTARILRWLDLAERQGADLIVFPEAALCGYPVWDLANKKQFLAEGMKCLKKIAAATRKKNIAVVVGFIDAGTAYGVRCTAKTSDAVHRTPYAFNALAWIEKGKIRTIYHKQLLPTYDVFLEDIFFRPGTETKVVSFRGYKVGLTICEDMWDERYEVKPLAALAKKKAELVLNISASPYYRAVAAAREKLLQGHVRRYGFPILYVNQVGGQDDLLFDGRSLFMDAKGRVLFKAPAFEEGLFFFSHDPSQPPRLKIRPRRLDPVREVYQALVMGVRDYFRKNGFRKAVIGLSGGIDSALVATIAVDALGKEAVKGVTMPGPFSSEGSWKDSEELAKNLGIAFEVRPIKEMYRTFLKKGKAPSPLSSPQGRGLGEGNAAQGKGPTLAMENLQARLRGMELMFISNDEGRLVLTTGNKSELAMGYCTLYGDMAGGLAVIGDVYKTDVYRLARYRNTLKKVIPEATLTKAPSAELRPNQKDQDSLPSYDALDEVLGLYIEKNLSRDEIIRKLMRKGKAFMSFPHVVSGNPDSGSPIKAFGDDKTKRISLLVNEVVRKVDHNEYKRRQTPPILRVTEKAWFGRRMPITNRFLG